MEDREKSITNEQLLAIARKGATAAAAEQLEVLRQFAAIDSGTGDEAGNAKVVELVDRQLEQIEGISIEHIVAPGYGTHIRARLRPAHSSSASGQAPGKIVLIAHMDTVFHPGDAEAHPYHEEGDTAYGLGIADCKGGILVAIHAVKIMQQAGMLPDKELVFLFNCDEEKGSPSGQAVFDQEIPGTQMVFAFEPSREENGVLTARKGNCSITIEVFGKKAHSGVNYLDGRSATVELAHKILRLYERNDNERGIQFNVSTLYGGEDGEGTVSAHARASVSVRVASQADIDLVKHILAEVKQDTYIEGTKTEIRITRMLPPMEADEKNHRLYTLVREAGRLLGQELPEQASGGCGDASYFHYHGVPAVDALGPYMYQIHCTEEALRISSFEEKTCLFAVVLGLLSQRPEESERKLFPLR